MVSYICYRCNYTTNRKSDIRTHLNRKTLCVNCGDNIKLTNSIKIYILQGLSYIKYKQIIDNTTNNNNNNINTTNNNNNNINTTKNNINIINTTKNNINTADNNIGCEYCNKLFKYTWCKTRHLKTCKIKNSEIELLKNENNKKNKEIIELKNLIENNNNEYKEQIEEFKYIIENNNKEYGEQIEEFKYIIEQKNKIIKENKAINKYSTNINSNNTTNNTSNHITINNYITPNIEYLEYNIKKECIYTDYVYFLPILKALFFNKEHPENHSISYSNTRSNKISVYNGNEWILQNRVDIINDIIDNCDDILSGFINEIRQSDKITYKQGKMINLYDKYISNYTLNDNDYKNLHEYIYMESKNLNIKPII